ncbi:MAG: MOSC domain-containing protein [Candidatus Binatia bacterium]
MDSKGAVVSIHVASTGAAPMWSVKEVQAVQGKGLTGDRYANELGTYSNDPGSGRDVTLIESEAVEALKRDYHVKLDAGQSRRNIVTHGISLNHLVGKDFRVGEVTLRGTRLCEPCSHMEKLTVKGALRGLIHRGGLRAEVVKSGTIRVGDSVVAESD